MEEGAEAVPRRWPEGLSGSLLSSLLTSVLLLATCPVGP